MERRLGIANGEFELDDRATMEETQTGYEVSQYRIGVRAKQALLQQCRSQRAFTLHRHLRYPRPILSATVIVKCNLGVLQDINPVDHDALKRFAAANIDLKIRATRSEERRVGKECRSR